ncbi:prolactin-releasing peptide receptor-like [Saccoglossus kowalevskii]|uniref:Prolactin-releasing peptide receptor-like n=1 Tax=Saccoglossus kowalevskii TaxID=10224 RepID=A0ABM0M0I8_SACKO|nr:PREDICTED: prolactin-releasing peptide receptor-like [Saccoglossus kowalevskii]
MEQTTEGAREFDIFYIDYKDYYECICYPQTCAVDIPDYIHLNVTSEEHLFSSYLYEDFDRSFCDQNDITTTGRTALIAVYTLTITLALVGNIVTIRVLAAGSRAKLEMNKFLINLAISDIMMAVFCMPFTFVYALLRRWIFGEVLCPLIFFTQHLSPFVSIFTLTAIGIERYLAVVRPMGRHVSRPHTNVILLMIWAISASLSTVQLVLARVKKTDNSNNTIMWECDEWWNSSLHETVYEICILGITYVMPLGVLWYSYQRVAYVLWKRKLPGNANGKRDALHSRAKIKVIRMLVAIVLAFGICWLPINTFNLVISIKDEYRNSPYYHGSVIRVFLCAHWVAMAHSCLNPIIYTCLHDEFRRDFTHFRSICRRTVIRRGRSKRRSSTTQTTTTSLYLKSKYVATTHATVSESC